MKAIIYESQNGSTKQYAELLGKKLDIPVYTITEAKTRIPAQTEIVFFGWVMAGTIKGLGKVSKLYRITAVCAVGMSMDSGNLPNLRRQNRIDEKTELFVLRGAYAPDRLQGIYRILMKMISGSLIRGLEEKEMRSEDETQMLHMLKHGGSGVDEANLDAVLAWIRQKTTVNQQ